MQVTCIMPTCNRRQFVPRAIACFLAQTFTDAELLILDDGDPVIDLIPQHPRIRYCATDPGMSLGAKRNFCCELANSLIIAHWDDDDWYGLNRLESQIATLQRTGAEITGYKDMLFWDGAKMTVYLGADNYACGTSLVYRKEFWKAHRFPNKNVGEDNDVVYRAGKALVTESGRGLIVATMHSGNTSPKTSSNFPEVPLSELPEGLISALQYHLQPQ